MKTTIRQTLLALTIMLSIVSCKKDKKTDPDTNPPPSEQVQSITFNDLKALSTGASVKVPADKKITGIVISDIAGKNIDSKTIVLQEATDKLGIVISFNAAQTFALGDQLEVIVSNQTLAQVNGEIVLQNVPISNAKKTGTGTITPKAVTTTDIATNKVAWDGVLVALSEGNLSGGNGKYSGHLTYTDAKGTVNSNTLADAAFANTAYPTSISSITGIVRIIGNDVSINIRNTNDVNPGAVIARTITEDFSTLHVDQQSFELKTDQLGVVNLDGKYKSQNPLNGDETFLQSGKNYLYILDNLSTISVGSKGQLKGIKQINVAFAGSKFVGYIDPSNPTYNAIKFDAAKDKVGITISLGDPSLSQTYQVATISYGDIGESHTLTYTLPASAAALEAALVSQGADPAEAKANAPIIFNSNSTIVKVSNISTKRVEFGYDLQPIVINQVVFGFDK